MAQSSVAPARILIVGGGPGGLACALWLKSLGLAAIVLEREARLGGMLRASTYDFPVMLGMPGLTGEGLADVYESHFASSEIERRTVEVLGVEAGPRVRTAEGMFDADAVVLATGTSHRRLGVTGEDESFAMGFARHIGRIHQFNDWAGRRVVVVGGADNAAVAALEVAELGASVTVLARRALTMQRGYEDRVRACEAITVRCPASVRAFLPGSGVVVRDADGERALPCDGVAVTAGFAPNTVPVDGLSLDGRGFIEVDGEQRTSVQGVWAIGDVCNPEHPNASSALGHAAIAARDIERVLRTRGE